MSVLFGTENGEFQYEALDVWEQLPKGIKLLECPGVAVDSLDQVYVLTRNQEHPVQVFSREGKWLKSFGRGTFSERTHGIFIDADNFIYCTDDGIHTVTKFDSNGSILMTLGKPNEPSPKWSGKPFNRPTHAAVSPVTGDIYVSDGYGNSRIHKYTPDGLLVKSWGEPGIDPGQFIRPHNIAIDRDGRVLVADRECHRIQIFDSDGNYISMWNNIHRPDGMTVGPDGNIYVGELNGMDGVDDAPGLGHRVSIISPIGELLARFGHTEEGEEPGKFIAPHGIAVDSHGDIYVGEVAFTIRGSHMNPPRELKSLKKLRKI